MVPEERQHPVQVRYDDVDAFGKLERGRQLLPGLDSVSEAIGRGSLSRQSMSSDGSTAITFRAPARAARNARTPVPVPMSNTSAPGFTARPIALAYASMRTRSRIIDPNAKRL